jgi:thiamine-triphosphatase
MRPTATCLLRRSVIEVERKFLPGVELVDRLRANRGPPAFRSLKYMGRRSFEDAYYDHDGILSSNGVWVRRRNKDWQAKVRQGGDYTNSQFGELSQRDEIAELVKKLTSGACPVESEAFGLQETARFTTHRDAWKADNRFKIVLDTTDFNHTVGEVELLEVLETKDNGEPALQQRRSIAFKMDSDIQDFMHHYSWAFPLGEPVGKLSAYFAGKR